MRHSNNYEKLVAAGFMIIRRDDYPVSQIKQWVSDSSWRTVENFNTKAARDRRVAELLDDNKIVEL